MMCEFFLLQSELRTDMKSTKFHTIMIVLHDFAGVSHNISALKTNPLWPERAQGLEGFTFRGDL